MFWVEEQVLFTFKRADYVMSDYRMTVRFLTTFFIKDLFKKRRLTSLKSEGREITREELHQLVWEKPGIVPAGEFGISDMGLAKTCKRLRVRSPQQALI